MLFKNMQEMFTYEELLKDFRKGLRNGNWRKIRRLEKTLYQALLWYSRVQGAIINSGNSLRNLLIIKHAVSEYLSQEEWKYGSL